ncbi:hypothetical protein MyNCGM683_21630 [Achromobacter xylosoxidans]
MSPCRQAGPLRRQRGSIYVGMLLLVAVLGLGLLKTGAVLATQQLREREAALLVVGEQFRAAIVSYYESGPGGRYPSTLGDLVEDVRTGRPVRHLRRIYADPLTGSPEWGLVPGPDGTIMGIYSLAPGKPLKQRNFPPGCDAFNDKQSYGEWIFIDHRRPFGEGGG